MGTPSSSKGIVLADDDAVRAYRADVPVVSVTAIKYVHDEMAVEENLHAFGSVDLIVIEGPNGRACCLCKWWARHYEGERTGLNDCRQNAPMASNRWSRLVRHVQS